MTESNEQSNLPGNLVPPVAPGEYLLNKAKIAEAKALISAYEEMNEAGKQSHDELAHELEQKIREGEQARELLLQLRSQSTLQVPFQRPAIDYPLSTSRIEEVPNYDSGAGHSQQVQYQQFQGTASQQTYKFMPQVTMQPVASSSYQQSNPQQWISGNPNGGQSSQYSPYSQKPTMQSSSTSYIPYGVPSAVRPQQLPTGQDRGNHDNHSRPVAPTQEQRHASSHQEPLHYGNSGSSQGRRRTAQMYSPPPTIPVHAPGSSSQAVYKGRPFQNTQQPEATVSQTQATASGPTYSHGPLPHKTTNTTSELATALGPQPNASSSNLRPVTVTSLNPLSTNPIANPNGDRTSVLNQNATHSSHPLTHIPATLPSINMHHTQFIRELRGAIKNWDAKAPPNSYFDHSSGYFRIHKDLKGAVRIIMRGQGHLKGHSQVVEVDQFCDWIRNRNTTSASPAVPADSQTGPSSASTPANARKAIPSTIHKAIPSTAHKANVQAQASSSSSHILQSATSHRPGYPEPGASSSKQTSSTVSSSTHNQGIARQIATPSSSSQIQLSTSDSVPQVPLSSPLGQPQTWQSPSYASVPKTPIRQISTVVNGLPRSAKQADKKSLASHILFGLGKRQRETDTSPTAFTEPQPKRHNTQQASVEVVADVSPSASYTVGQATPAVQEPNLPNGASTASFSLRQPLQQDFITPSLPREAQQISQALSASSGDQQQPGDQQQSVNNATLDVPSTSRAAAAVEISEMSKTPSLQDASTVPLATSSTVVQVSTLPSPVHLAVPVPVPSLLESGEITQPIASTILEQPQPSTPAKFQSSLADALGLGTSAQMAQKNQPLFLPSPVSSPGVDANDDVSISGSQSANVVSRICDLRKFSSSGKRRNYAFVLAPRRPPYLVKYFQLEKQKKRSFLSKSVAGEEDFYDATESPPPSYAEQRAVQLACSRLQELPCKWDGCSVKMNSVDTLIHHLNRQHKARTSHNSNYFLCRWTQCGRRCTFYEKHLEKHAYLPLNCPYEDCEESFRSAPPLLKHTRVEHENDELKPSAHLWYPRVELPDTVLGVLPSYMITTRGVDPEEISSARHAILAPRVLRDISGLERERSKNKAKKTDEDSSNDYDFLNARPTRYSSQLSRGVDMRLEDLNCEDISRLVDEGLTLWGRERAVRPVSPRPVVDREHRTE